jgi:hypothetical protein
MTDSQSITTVPSASVIEQVIAAGDLSRLTPAQRVRYYLEVCDALGIDPRLKPFEYIHLQGRLTLYATRTATDQLRARRGISVEIVAREVIDGSIYVVTARATSPDGRRDEAIGAVSIEGLKGDALANALMRAETKAKRRVTLSICGLGMADESEVASIPDARVVAVDATTGEIQGELPEPEQVREPSVPDTALEHIAKLLREHNVKARALCEVLGIQEPDRNRWREQVREAMEAQGLTLNDVRLLIEGLAGEVE